MGKEDFDKLEKKENQDIEPTLENENKDNKDNTDNKKPSEEDLEDLMEKMQKLVEEVSDQYGVDPNKIKVMALPKPKFTFLSVLISSLVILAFDFVLIVALSAIFDWATWSSLSKLIFFALMFALGEVILKLASLPLFQIKKTNIIILSLIKVLPFIIICIICAIWPIFIHIESYYLYILICILIYAVRKFYTSYFLEKQMKKLMKKHTKRILKKKDNNKHNN